MLLCEGKGEVMQALIVDDDVGLTELLANYLEVAGFTVDVASSGEAALAAPNLGRYDILLLDVMMPGMDGFEVLRQIRRRFATLPVIMLTAKGDEDDRIRGLDGGADDYLAKPFSSRELVARMRARLRGTAGLALQEPVNIGDLRLYVAHNVVEVAGERVVLTEAEMAALQLLCAHQGQAVSRETLSAKVLHRAYSPLDRSLDTHMCNLRRKLGATTDGFPRINAVRGVGYRYSG